MIADIQNFLLKVRNHCSREQAILLLVCLGSACVLMLSVPYAEGYEADRVDLARMMINISNGYEDWQHCIFVPFIAVGLCLWKMSTQTLPKSETFFPALAGLILCLLIYYAGYKMANQYIGFFSVQGVLFFSIAYACGIQTLKFFFFPLVFLAFAWPMPFMDTVIAFPLRMIMSQASVFVLNGIGIDVVRVGTGILSAPDSITGLPAGKKFSVDVADPCSGIRSLFALMMVSALYGYFTMKTWWKHLLLFLSSIPLAILGNLCRILMLTFGTIAMGPEIAIGTLENPSFFHMLAGYAVFAVALVGMVAVGWILNHMGDFFRRGAEGSEGSDDKKVHETKSVAKTKTADVPTESEDLY